MTWFRRGKKGIKAQPDRKEVPSGLWLKCDECGEILYRPELEKACWVCGKCNFHFRIGSRTASPCRSAADCHPRRGRPLSVP